MIIMKRNADLKINDNDMWNRNCEPFLSTRVHPRVFSGVFFGLIFSFLCNSLFIVVCPFVLFLLAIVLSVITASEYFFGIFKLSYSQINYTKYKIYINFELYMASNLCQYI